MNLKRLAQDTAWRMALGGAFFATIYLNPTEMVSVLHPGVDTPAATVKADRAELLIRRHQCWLGEAPVPVTLPGGVVIRKANGRVVYSRELVGPALDAALGGEASRFDVLAFCK